MGEQQSPCQGSCQGNQVDFMPPVKSHTDTNFSFSELESQACFGKNLCIDQCICGTIVLTCDAFWGSKSFPASQAGGCSLSWGMLHNTVKAMSSWLPFKGFSRTFIADLCTRGWRKSCCVTHLGTEKIPVSSSGRDCQNAGMKNEVQTEL